MKRLLIITLLIACSVSAYAASQKYYEFPDANKIYDNDRVLVFQNTSGSRNLTGANLKKQVLAFPNISGAQTVKGNLVFSGTARRITGDMSSTTQLNRLAFQNSFSNAATVPLFLPSGTAVTSGIRAVNNSDPTNSSWLQFGTGTDATFNQIQSSRSGTGNFIPLRILADNVTAITCTASGTSTAGSNTLVLINAASTTDTVTKFQVVGTTKQSVYTVATLPVGTAGCRSFVSDSTATLAAGLGNIVAGTGSNFVPVYHDGTNWRIGG